MEQLGGLTLIIYWIEFSLFLEGMMEGGNGKVSHFAWSRLLESSWF